MTVEELKEAVNEFFNDRSRSPMETLEGLEEVLEEVKSLIQALEEEG